MTEPEPEPEPDPTPALEAVKSALFELTELPDAARAQRLAEWAAQRPGMARALQALLPGAMVTVAGVQGPARWLQSLANSGLPQRLGHWQVLREIGRGGMGVVLLGERADGAFDKQVAIKVLPPMLAGADGGRRLTTEAQVLARLEHPHIARLLDAGIDQGCAYLVMEHVAGQPITDHARHRGMNLRQKLALVLQLCGAVQFVHSQLLVHRDIKPDNVLVDAAGQVRLLDFGIAKVLSAEEVQATVTLQAAFTPGYASPEQLLGQPAGVAGDVFSLGVLLFELLAGSHPFSAPASAAGGAAGALALARAVLESPPNAAALRAASLPADLQAVLLKALEKLPHRRYTSAEALAGELQAFLDGLPVKAQPPSWRYRAAKFAQRNRWPVLAGLTATVAVLGFAGWALNSAQQARQQEALAQSRLLTVRAIANKVVFDYNRALEPVPGTLEVRKTLVADALTYLNAMAAEAHGDDALLVDLAAGYEAVGDVQGRGVTGGNLGDLAAAERSYRRAEALRKTLCDTAPIGKPPAAMNTAPAAACSAWAATLVRLGDNAFTQRRTEEAIAHFDTAREAAGRVLDMPLPTDDSGRLAALELRLQANQRLAGMSLRQTGDAYSRGLPLAHAQLQAAQDWAKEQHGVKSQEALRVAHDFLAVRLLSEGQPGLALPHIEEAVRLARTQQSHRSARDAGVTLSTSLVRAAEIHAHLLQPAATMPLLREALALARGLHEAEPEDRHLRARYANVGWRAGEVYHLLGSGPALQTSATALPAVLAAAQFKPEDGVFYMQHQRVQQEVARNALARGLPAQALAGLQAFPTAVPANPSAAADLADVMLMRAAAQRALGHGDAARRAFDAGLAALQAAADQTPGNVQLACRVMQARLWAARWAQAEPSVAAAYAPLAGPVPAGRAALEAAGKLSPYWAQALAL